MTDEIAPHVLQTAIHGDPQAILEARTHYWPLIRAQLSASFGEGAFNDVLADEIADRLGTRIGEYQIDQGAPFSTWVRGLILELAAASEAPSQVLARAMQGEESARQAVLRLCGPKIQTAFEAIKRHNGLVYAQLAASFGKGPFNEVLADEVYDRILTRIGEYQLESGQPFSEWIRRLIIEFASADQVPPRVLERAVRGEDAARQAVVRLCPRTIQSAVARHAPPEACDDAAALTALAIWKLLPRYKLREGHSFEAWVQVIAMQQCLSLAVAPPRDNRRHTAQARAFGLEPSAPTLERMLDTVMQLGLMDDEEREILERRTIAEETFESIARSLGKSSVVVYKKFERVRARLMGAPHSERRSRSPGQLEGLRVMRDRDEDDVVD